MKPIEEPKDDLTSLGSSLLKGDVLKIYYLMILTGTPPAYANRFMFNLRFSDQRANAINVRNMLITSLKQTLLKVVADPILYQRARSLANRHEFNVFEDIEIELKNQLDEFSVADIMKRLTTLNKDTGFKKKISNYIINFTEEQELMSTGTAGIAGLPPDQPIVGVGNKKGRLKGRLKGILMTQITRRGSMVGNPLFALTNEGYSKAINGSLPQEIQESLSEHGIVVLENADTESMMFLVQDELNESDCSDCESECPDCDQEEITEAKKKKKKKKKLDPVGEEDDDVNNDGESTSSDKFLMRRRRAVSAAMMLRKKK